MYCRIITHALTTLKYLLDVELDQLSPEQYIQMSQFDFLDYIYSRDHVVFSLSRKKPIAIWSILSL